MGSIGRIVAGVATMGASELWVPLAKAGAKEVVNGIDEATGAKKAREDAAALAATQEQRQQRLMADAKAKEAEQTSTTAALQARMTARKRQRELAGGTQGFGGTLATGPRGLTDSIVAAAKGKSLLGL